MIKYLYCLLCTSAMAGILPPPAATQSEVNAGVVTSKYVSPATLSGWSGGGISGIVFTNRSAITPGGSGVTIRDTNNSAVFSAQPTYTEIKWVDPAGSGDYVKTKVDSTGVNFHGQKGATIIDSGFSYNSGFYGDGSGLTNVGGGIANGQNGVTLGSTTFTNGVTMGRTNDSNNGVTLATVISSNALVNYNFTMAANDIGGQLHPDHVFYQGFNVAPGGGNAIAGQPAFYWGMENEWQGAFEHYIQFRNFGGDISYRPFFYSINRTNGNAGVIFKGDTFQWLSTSNHTTEVFYFDTNSMKIEVPMAIIPPATSNALSITDNAGATRIVVTNGYLNYRNTYLMTDANGMIYLSSDTSFTNNANVGITANYFRTYGKPGSTPMTNTYQNGGVTVGTNSWGVTVDTDVAGIQVNNGNGARSTMVSLGVGGVQDRTVIYCVGSTDNTALAGHAQYDTLIKSKKGIFFTANDSAQNDMQISNRWVNVNGQLTATQYNFPTNAAPTGVTIGVTAPDNWVKAYNAAGNFIGYMPVYTNH